MPGVASAPGADRDHDVMRPSVFVIPRRGAEGPRGARRVRVTLRLGAGRPVVVSRTWQVIGGRGLEVNDMVIGLAVADGIVP